MHRHKRVFRSFAVMDKASEEKNQAPSLELSKAHGQRYAPIALALYAFVGGFVSFIGWMADIPRLADWYGHGITIQPNTTITVMSAAAAVTLISFGYFRFSSVLAAVVASIGLASVVQTASGIDLGINTFLMFGREWGRAGVVIPGLMGPPSAVSWTLIGTSLLFLLFSKRHNSKEFKQTRTASVTLAAVAMGISTLSLIGYIYGAEALYTLPRYSVIALQTATFIFAVSLGIVLSIPESGPMRVFGEAGPAGILARRLVPALVILPILIGFIRLGGERWGYYDLAFGSALRTVVEIVLLLALLWWAGNAITRHAKQAEDSQTALKHLADAMPQVVWMSDNKGLVEYYNDRAADFAGIKATPGGKYDWQPGLHPDDLEDTLESWETAVKKAGVYAQEHRILMADGTFRWHLSRAVPAPTSNGGEPKWYGTATDIHDLKTAEHALRESEQRFARFMQNLPGLAWIKDREGRYVFANEAAQIAFGKTSAELYGKVDHEIFPASTADSFVENDRKAYESGSGRQTVEALKDNNGVLRYSLVNKFPIHVNGEPVLLGGVAIDITEQKIAQDNHQFLFRIADKIRVARNADALMGEIADELGSFLGLHRCLFNEIDTDSDLEIVYRDYSRDGESVAGMHKISDYSSVNSEDMARGMTIVNRDSKNDPRTVEYFEKTYGPNKELAYVAVPMMRERKWVASLWCSDDHARDWTNHEITLIENIAERSWAAVERLRNEIVTSKLASIVQSSDDAIVSKDLSGIITSWNRGAERLFGYRESEVLGKSVTILIPEERLDEEPKILERIRRGESIDHYETIRKRKDGTLLDISLTVSPIYDSDGRIIGASKVARDITTRLEAERKLRESEERFSKAFKASPLILTISSLATGKLLEVNDTFIAVTGYTREEAVGKTTLDLGLWARPSDRDAELEIIRNDGEVASTEYAFRMRDGREIIGLLSAERIEIAGEPCALTVIQDITERKQAQERLRASETQLRLVTDAIPALVSYIDKTQRYRFVNRQYSEWFGKRGEELLGARLRDVVGQRAYKVIKPHVEEALAGNEVSFDSWIHYKGAGQRFVHISYVPDIQSDGTVAGLYALVSDLSELKRSEDLLSASQERMRLLTESFTDYAILSTDNEGRVDSWNPGAAAIFGYEEAEIIGRSAEILFTPEDVTKGIPLKEMRNARKHGRASDERWHMRKDGSRFFASGVMVPLYVGRVLSGYAKIAADLTERKRSAEALQRAHDEMEMRVLERTRELAETNAALRAEIAERKAAEDQKIDLLKRLVTTQEDERRRIARDLHDQLGQRLTALRLKIASLREMVGEYPELQERTNRLQEIGELLDSEVSFLAWELRPSPIDELGLTDAIGTFAREWSRHYGIPAEFHSTGMANLDLDPDSDTHLYRIAQEALNNIVKHADANKVNILVERSDGEVILIVEDDGKGFDRSAIKQNRKSGKGLGLTGMEERASLIGGRVEIESAAGSGTTVFARVPLKSSKAIQER
jgi:PAS domain S-box-containing protein